MSCVAKGLGKESKRKPRWVAGGRNGKALGALGKRSVSLGRKRRSKKRRIARLGEKWYRF